MAAERNFSEFNERGIELNSHGCLATAPRRTHARRHQPPRVFFTLVSFLSSWPSFLSREPCTLHACWCAAARTRCRARARPTRRGHFTEHLVCAPKSPTLPSPFLASLVNKLCPGPARRKAQDPSSFSSLRTHRRNHQMHQMTSALEASQHGTRNHISLRSPISCHVRK